MFENQKSDQPLGFTWKVPKQIQRTKHPATFDCGIVFANIPWIFPSDYQYSFNNQYSIDIPIIIPNIPSIINIPLMIDIPIFH